MDKREREEQLKRADGGKERNDEGLVRKKKSRVSGMGDETDYNNFSHVFFRLAVGYDLL